MPKILFIAAHRADRSPSQRFRFEQYIKILEENKFECVFSNLLDEEDDKTFYKPGNFFSKLSIFFKTLRKRFKDISTAKSCDIVFVQREAFMLGTSYFERRFKKSGAKLVFDFDDAIWHLDTSEGNKKFEWLKNPAKTGKIISYSDMIFAGNDYLANYAKNFNKNVKLIPTTIDVKEYNRNGFEKNDETICIGWSGSITTIKHFEHALEFLKKIKERYGSKISVKVIGDGNFENMELGVKGLAWNKSDEIKELSSFDIGIMPLPNDEWANGKCGLKGLQYMALEIPTIMSPVGVNTTIIQHGINGFLAETLDEWVECIAKLIDQPELRSKIGKAARQTVVDKYSVEANKHLYLNSFTELLNTNKS